MPKHVEIADKIEQELINPYYYAGYFKALHDCVFDLSEFDVENAIEWLTKQLKFTDDLDNPYYKGYNDGVDTVINYIDSNTFKGHY